MKTLGFGQKKSVLILFALILLFFAMLSALVVIYVSNSYKNKYKQYSFEAVSQNAYVILEVATLDISREDLIRVQRIVRLHSGEAYVSITHNPLSTLTYYPKVDDSGDYSYNDILAFMYENISTFTSAPELSIYIQEYDRWLNYNIQGYIAPWYWFLIVIVAIVPIIVILLLLFASYKLISPWRNLNNISAYIGVKRDKSMPVTSWGLISDSSKLIDLMIKQIDRSEKQKKQIIDLLAHNIRTPITRIKLYIELMSDQNYKSKISDQLASINHQVSELINYSKIRQDMSELVELDLLSYLQQLAQDIGQDFSVRLEHNLTTSVATITVQDVVFYAAVNNIVDNALKYGFDLLISIKASDLHYHVRFQNKIKKDRLNVMKGTGIGLKLTQFMIEDNKGQLLVLQEDSYFIVDLILEKS